MNSTPTYIKSLVTPIKANKPQARKVWSIDLETVWLPFFTATNTMGDTAIPSEAIGCPMRLAYDKAGAVRFSQNGKPVIRVAKEVGDSVKMVRDNFVANLLQYTGEVMTSHSEEYTNQLSLAEKLGKPIAQLDASNLSKAIEAMKEAEAEATTEATTTEAEATLEAVLVS
jgi:hypothetical protein